MAAESHEFEQRVLVSRYRIERELGAGAMATVYLAEDLRHNRSVAIKVLNPELAAGIGSDRFLREIAITARLTHPHILPLIDSGEADGLLYYVLPFVDGDTLRKRMELEKQLPLEDALQITREVADALGYAHSHGIVHRDVKPENILIGARHALVADFGIAHAASIAGVDALTQTGIVLGTPLYMSPEQGSGERGVDGRSDVYSLACVLYEMLSGQPPFTGATAGAIIARKSTERPHGLRVVRNTVPEAVEAAVLRALATAPADRFNSAKEFVEALDLARSDEKPNVTRRQRRTAFALSGALVAVIAALITMFALKDGRGGVGPASAASQSIKSIAVLPFDNLSALPGQDYFADGIHDALITRLWQLRKLRALPRAAVTPYKNTNVPLGQIARELEVEAVLEGSFASDSNRVRIIARLIDVAGGRTLWDSMFDRSRENVLALQAELAEAIVSGIQVSVTPDERSRLIASRPVLREAHEALLRGRELVQQNTADGYAKGIDYLVQATLLDTTYADAWAALGRAYNGAVLMGHLPPRASADSARYFIGRALALDSSLAEAHLALATLLLRYDWDWSGAGREYERAVALAPNYAQAHEEYAWYLTAIGQHERALTEARRTRELDPITGDRTLGWVYQRMGDAEKSAAHYNKILELNDDMPWYYALLAASYAMSGRYADAAKECDKVVPNDRDSPTSGVCAQVYGLANRLPDARRIIAQMEAARRPAADPYFVALAYTAVRDTSKVLAWLQRAYRERSPNLWGLKYANLGRFDLVRNEPIFKEIIRSMNYP